MGSKVCSKCNGIGIVRNAKRGCQERCAHCRGTGQVDYKRMDGGRHGSHSDGATADSK